MISENKRMLKMWWDDEKQKDKEMAYAFSDRDKKHIMTQTYGKIIAELWKLNPPKFSPKQAQIILKEYPKLKEFPKDLGLLLYYSIKATNFVWSVSKVDYSENVLDAMPGYKEAKERFQKEYGKKGQNK